jgi:hypothetical protein
MTPSATTSDGAFRTRRVIPFSPRACSMAAPFKSGERANPPGSQLRPNDYALSCSVSVHPGGSRGQVENGSQTAQTSVSSPMGRVGDTDPSYSPDGTMIAFIRSVDGEIQLTRWPGRGGEGLDRALHHCAMIDDATAALLDAALLLWRADRQRHDGIALASLPFADP